MNILEILVLLIILVYIVRGFCDGLVLSVCSLATLVLAIFITQTVSPILSQQIKQSEGCVNFLSEKIEHVLNLNEETEKSAKRDKKVQAENEKIQSLPIPESVKKNLISNNNSSSYEEIGADTFKKYVSRYITYLLITCICYIAVFMISVFALKIIARTIDIFTKLPVIHTLNQLGGGIVGAIKGVIVVWVLFIIIIMSSATEFGAVLYRQIEASNFLKTLFNNNVILNLITHLMGVLL